MNASTLEPERVRRHTSPVVNAKIDQQIAGTVRRYAGEPADVITERIEELEHEWDIERVLETNASSLALAGIGLGAMFSKKWLALSGTVLGFLLLHATQGWCPPVPLLRRKGIRTCTEIQRERFALKVLRGDFNDVIHNGNPVSSEQLLAAMQR
jgi:hypothetical protein